MKRTAIAVYSSPLFIVAFLGMASPAAAQAPQGQALEKVKVDLPPSPNFNITNAPEVYPDGSMSIYGVRRKMNKFLDKDVQIKAYLIEIYECPAELRKCNDELAAKSKKAKKKEMKSGKAPEPAAEEPGKGGCRPCDQPHFFIADTASTPKERALVVADYPIKDWTTGKPKALVAKAGDQYLVTGTFSINSMTGFAASDGLLIHKKFQDMQGTVLAEGNAVLPPDAQQICLEGKPCEKVGGVRIDEAAGGGGAKAPAQTSAAPTKGANKGVPKEL